MHYHFDGDLDARDAYASPGRLIRIVNDSDQPMEFLDAVDVLIEPQVLYTDADGKLFCSHCRKEVRDVGPVQPNP
jgi:hypothetical protein